MQAHNLEEKERTQDVCVDESINFDTLFLSDPIMNSLKKNGFRKPSPIQLKAIPLGRCGFDLVIKSKSGTGKTAVFGIIALEMINVKSNSLQVLILAPTREIAVQIQDVIKMIGVDYKGLKVESFIGGLPMDDDLEKLHLCHIAVGSPGRVKHLIDQGNMKIDSVRLFVLDEADKLMESSYQSQINQIYHKLPPRKQVLAVSATYPDALDTFLGRYMQNPTHVSTTAQSPLLLGMRQCVALVKSNLNVIHQMNIKVEMLLALLSKVSYTQCLIFSNFQTRCESLSNILNRKGWKSTYISSTQNQVDRLEAVTSLRDLKCRILLSTDITARGIDAPNVDLVINYDVPHESSTYLHRMGRAGRYGAQGIAVTLAAKGKEQLQLQNIIGCIGGNDLNIVILPQIENFPDNLWNSDFNTFEQLPAIVDENCVNEQKTKMKNIKESIFEFKNARKLNKGMKTKTSSGTPKIDKAKTNLNENVDKMDTDDVSISRKIISEDQSNDEIKYEVQKDTSDMYGENDICKILDSMNQSNAIENSLAMSFNPQLLLEKLVKGKNIEMVNASKRIDENAPESGTNSQIIDSNMRSIDEEKHLTDSPIINKEPTINEIQITDTLTSTESMHTGIQSIDSKVTNIHDDTDATKYFTDESSLDSSPCKRKREKRAVPLHKASAKLPILQRNIALYNVAKLLTGTSEQLAIDPDIIESLDDYSNSQMDEDSNKIKSSMQQCQNLSCTEILESIKVLSEKNEYAENSEQICTDNHDTKDVLENVFTHAYNYATNSSEPHWLDAIGEEFVEDAVDVASTVEDGKINLLDTDEEFEDEEEFEEVSTRSYRKKHFSNNRKRYRKSMQRTPEPDHALNENFMQWVAVDHSKSNNLPVSDCHQELYNYNLPVSHENPTSYADEQYNVDYPNLTADIDYNQSAIYSSYFNQYSQQLAEKAEEFEDVETFDSWLLNWQQQIRGVRDYIQQNIYVEEMKKYTLN